jgi:hypothetical protein
MDDAAATSTIVSREQSAVMAFWDVLDTRTPEILPPIQGLQRVESPPQRSSSPHHGSRAMHHPQGTPAAKLSSPSESALALRAFDAHGDGLTHYLASTPTSKEWQDYRKLVPIGASRGCVRFLSETIAGGPPKLLPVVSLDDLQQVLRLARVRIDHWGERLVTALFAELDSLSATLFSDAPQSQPFAWHDDREHGADADDDAPLLCPYLLLKRKSVVVHVLNTSTAMELVQLKAPPSKNNPKKAGGADDDRGATVMHERLSARLKDRTPPTQVAVELVSSALGVPHQTVRLLDEHPTLKRIGSQRCVYPGLCSEQTCYILRVSVEGLPTHPFRTQQVDWAWLPLSGSRRPEVVAWSRPEPQPQQHEQTIRRRAYAHPLRVGERVPRTDN